MNIEVAILLSFCFAYLLPYLSAAHDQSAEEKISFLRDWHIKRFEITCDKRLAARARFGLGWVQWLSVLQGAAKRTRAVS